MVIKRMIFALAFTLAGLTSYAQNNKPFVIPNLQQWTGKTGFFSLGNNIRLVVANQQQLDRSATYINTFASDLKHLHPHKKVSVVVGKPKTGDIYFTLGDEPKAPSAEAYQLDIDAYVSVKATEPIGLFWGTRSILQILEGQLGAAKMPKGVTVDFPGYKVRGFVLDVARKYFTIDFLRSYVKLLAYYKVNDFQIHLNDNGFKQYFNDDWDKTYAAFRLENDTYPGLTAKDGSYTKKEFVDLQALGNAYGVNIVPEIDAPAHALSIARVVPEIASTKYGKDHLDITNPKTYEVMHNIFKEYLQGPNPVFRNAEVHIGTDEYAKEEAESFRKFTDSTIKFVESFGKKVRLWGALSHAPGKTPVKVKGVTMNLWYNGFADPKEMFRLGYEGISTPDKWLYIVPKAGYYFDYLNLKKIYAEWAPNVIGDQVFEKKHPLIKGGSFAVWNDHVGNGITAFDVTDRAFPALQVVSQKMWRGNTADTLSFSVFDQLRKNIGEAPGVNMRAKVLGKDSLVLSYQFDKAKIADLSGNKRSALSVENVTIANATASFKGQESFIKTPIKEIGYNYTVSFQVNPSSNNPADATLFSSTNAEVKLKQGNTGMLGFSRENYHYNFNYKLPENTWTKVTITGDHKGTALYINGSLVERLEGAMYTYTNTKDKMAKVQTLVFPLQYIGGQNNSFSGQLKSLKVFNKILTEQQIEGL